MKRPPPVEDEQARLETLEKYEVLDTPAEQAFDDLVHLAAHVTDASAAMLSLVDEDRQWFKARHGIDQRETRRELSFCAHQLGDPDEMLIVEDATEDPRFEDHPYVRDDPGIRFYAGRPLVSPEGHVLGSLCVVDEEPRSLPDDQREMLDALGRQAMLNLELRRHKAALAERLEGLNDQLEKLGVDRVAPLSPEEGVGPDDELGRI